MLVVGGFGDYDTSFGRIPQELNRMMEATLREKNVLFYWPTQADRNIRDAEGKVYEGYMAQQLRHVVTVMMEEMIPFQNGPAVKSVRKAAPETGTTRHAPVTNRAQPIEDPAILRGGRTLQDLEKLNLELEKANAVWIERQTNLNQRIRSLGDENAASQKKVEGLYREIMQRDENNYEVQVGNIVKTHNK